MDLRKKPCAGPAKIRPVRVLTDVCDAQKAGMTMDAATAFGTRREALREQLMASVNTDEAIRAVTMALEQTASDLLQDEQDERARQRRQAVLALARRAPQFLAAARSQGELRVRAADGAQTSAARDTEKRTFGMREAGVLILAALAVMQLADGKLFFAALQAAGAALLIWDALRARRTAAGDGLAGVEAVAMTCVDADALVRAVDELIAAVDVCVSDLALLERDAGFTSHAGADEATIDLLVSLMEAKQTDRGDVALSSLAQAEQYLLALGIECAYYSRENAAMFDLLPTLAQERTIRPALLKDGKLIRRGVAACKMQRSYNA